MSTSLSWGATAEPKEPNPVQDTWNDIAMPIPRTLQELEGEEEGNVWGTDIEVLTGRLGIDANQIAQQLESLEDARFISIKDNAQTFGNPNGHYGINCSGVRCVSRSRVV